MTRRKDYHIGGLHIIVRTWPTYVGSSTYGIQLWGSGHPWRRTLDVFLGRALLTLRREAIGVHE